MIAGALRGLRGLYLHGKRERLYVKSRWKETADACRAILEADPGDRRALHDLAVALRHLKDAEGSLKACRRLFELAPKVRADLQFGMEGSRYLRYILVYGRLLLERGSGEAARRVLEPLKRMGAHFHDKYFLLSGIHKEEGRLWQAAAELEEMQAVYEAQDLALWEPGILVRAESLFELSRRRGDADGAFIAARVLARVLARVHERRGETELKVQDGLADEGQRRQALSVAAHAALQRKKPQEAEAGAAGLGWPELAERFAVAAAACRGEEEACLRRLSALPAESPFRLEQLRSMRRAAFRGPESLRAFAESHLEAGLVEDAYDAAHSLAASFAAGLADLDRLRDLRLLLLDRAIWEDEARLGLHPDPDVDLTRRVLPPGPETAALRCAGRTLAVRLSDAFRLGSGPAAGADPDAVRLRLAENYLRRGSRDQEALELLQGLAGKDSPHRLRALSRIALAFIRKGPPDAARPALGRFMDAAPAAETGPAKELYLELGAACEAAGMPEEAGRLYGAILAVDAGFSDVRQRMDALREDRRGAARPAAGLTRIQERFSDLSPIGRGGMGVVFKAFDPLFNREVALKVIPEGSAPDPDVIARFVREAQAMVQLLRHPGIVELYEVGLQGDLYIAMELVAGHSLRRVLADRGRLPPAEAAGLARALAAALGHAHGQGILHRDVKPDNVLMDRAGLPKLVDFGLAGVAGATRLTAAGSVMGTAAYMSPEAVRGGAADPRSDIYSLGTALFELATGRVPFPEGDIGYHQLHTPPPAPRGLAPGIPEPLEACILRCLEKDPARRFQSCGELSAALEAA